MVTILWTDYLHSLLTLFCSTAARTLSFLFLSGWFRPFPHIPYHNIFLCLAWSLVIHSFFRRSDLLSFYSSISCFIHTIHNVTLLSSFSFAMRFLFLSSGVPSILLNCTLASSLVPCSQIKAARPSGLTPISSTKPDLFTLKPMIPSSTVPGCLLLLPT